MINYQNRDSYVISGGDSGDYDCNKVIMRLLIVMIMLKIMMWLMMMMIKMMMMRLMMMI